MYSLGVFRAFIRLSVMKGVKLYMMKRLVWQLIFCIRLFVAHIFRIQNTLITFCPEKICIYLKKIIQTSGTKTSSISSILFATFYGGENSGIERVFAQWSSGTEIPYCLYTSRGNI